MTNNRAPVEEKCGWIRTLESETFHVIPSDWIITGVKGEVYPCKDDIFRETYIRSGVGDALEDCIAQNLYRRERYLIGGRADGDLFTECVATTQSSYRRWAKFLLGQDVDENVKPRAALTSQKEKP